MLRNDGPGEQMIRLRVAVKTRHRAGPGERNHQRQNKRPGRGENAPTADTPVDALLRKPRVDAIEHDLPRYIAPQQNISAASLVQIPSGMSVMPSHSGDRTSRGDDRPGAAPAIYSGKAAQEACA
jgi:hypothetical protein